MKKVTINVNHVGLVSRNGDYKRVLTAGSYWLSLWDDVMIYNMSLPFQTSDELNILLKDEELAKLLLVVDVHENEIALLYQDKLFKQVLTSGQYAFWKGAREYTYIKADLNNIEIEGNISRNFLEKPALAAWVRSFRVEAYEKALLFIDGKMEKVLDAGTYYWWKNSIIIQVVKTDIRQLSLEIPGQEILTKDKAQLRINFTVQYRVLDIVKALSDNREFEKQLYILLQLSLRELVGRLGFDELMESKEKLADNIMSAARAKTSSLGVELIDCGVKDIILPGDVKDIMNQVLIAEKRAQANIIMRREETASTRSLLNTAKLMEDNSMLFKLKEMEYVEKIAEKIHTITLSGGGQIVDQLKQLFVK
jgi:hypothetical protein